MPDEVPGFCKAATRDDIRTHDYALTPGRYVGTQDGPDDEDPSRRGFPRLVKELEDEFAEGSRLEKEIRTNLARLDLSRQQ